MGVPVNDPLSCSDLQETGVSTAAMPARRVDTTYKREELPDIAYPLPVLSRWRQPILHNRHGAVVLRKGGVGEEQMPPAAGCLLINKCCYTAEW